MVQVSEVSWKAHRSLNLQRRLAKLSRILLNIKNYFILNLQNRPFWPLFNFWPRARRQMDWVNCEFTIRCWLKSYRVLLMKNCRSVEFHENVEFFKKLDLHVFLVSVLSIRHVWKSLYAIFDLPLKVLNWKTDLR